MDGVKGLLAKLAGWKYVLLIAVLGLALLLWPSGASAERAEAAEEELRLEALLTQIEGVGEVHLLVSENGAAVVCEGADSAAVRLGICEALRCYAGLGTDRIRIFQLKG